MTNLTQTIRDLSSAHREVLARIIAQRGCSGVHGATVKALAKRGLLFRARGQGYVPSVACGEAWEELCRERGVEKCPICDGERLVIQGRWLCPRGHGKSVPAPARKLEKDERRRLEIVPADLSKVPVAGFVQ
jgi:hypothetical protein